MLCVCFCCLLVTFLVCLCIFCSYGQLYKINLYNWLYMLLTLKFVLNHFRPLKCTWLLSFKEVPCCLWSSELPSLSETTLSVIISGVWVNVPVFSLLSCQYDWHAFGSWFIQKPRLITISFLSSSLIRRERCCSTSNVGQKAGISFCCTMLHFCVLLLSLPPLFRSHNVKISDYRTFVGLFRVIRSFNWGPRHNRIS